MKIIALLIFILFATPGCASTQPGSSPALYRITSPTGHSAYLFGSVHAGSEDWLPLPSYIMDAFNRSDYLALEFDFVDPMEHGRTMSEAMERERAQRGIGTFASIVGLDEFLRVHSALREAYELAGQPITIQPTVTTADIISIISYIPFSHHTNNLGISFEASPDRYIINAISHQQTLILEGADFYAALFYSLPFDITQLLLIDQAMKQLEEGTWRDYDIFGRRNREEIMQETMEAWRTGDEARRYAIRHPLMGNYENLTQEQFQLYYYMHYVFLNGRTAYMAQNLSNYMAEGKNIFAMIGYTHTIGPGSIPYLLRQQGYIIETVTA